ncbi:hypothetical protein KP509_22G023300 [Ceratopteris richardii]|uniref:Uncharacterized protein n=1 Tax=Ceratopteris richardii TaxID=49495 RepID=A0A8T2S4B2_CERRI|nr:hypothetical protein KP509_22G023300 [Ceratopteris richardii]
MCVFIYMYVFVWEKKNQILVKLSLNGPPHRTKTSLNSYDVSVGHSEIWNPSPPKVILIMR